MLERYNLHFAFTYQGMIVFKMKFVSTQERPMKNFEIII